MARPDLGTWRPTQPEGALEWLRTCDRLWWLAGGWALDRFLGETTRDHGDLDVACLRRDVNELLHALKGWEFFEAHAGELHQLDRSAHPAAHVHSLWCRPQGSREWYLEVLMDESEGEEWLFRRETSIRLPLTRLLWRDGAGLVCLRPEVQLLYKAKATRQHDQQDFDRVLPRLEPQSRIWLKQSLERVDPLHAWITKL